MSRFLLLVATVVALTGCSHTRVVNPASPDDQIRVNQHAEGKAASVTLSNGERIRARNLRMTETLTTWIDPESGALDSTATGNIESIRFRNRGQGFLEGAGIGLGVGLVGSVLALSMSPRGEEESPATDILWGMARGFVAVILPIETTAIGGVSGLIIGKRTTYAPVPSGGDP